MASALVRSYASGPTAGSSTATVDPGGSIQTGDWMIVVLSWNTAGAVHSAPATGSWTQLGTTTIVGTLASSVWAGVRGAGDGTYVFTSTVSGWGRWAVIFGTGGKPKADWVTAQQSRAATGTNNTNVAPAITAQADNCLAVSVSTERTTATEADVTSVAGTTKLFFSPQLNGTQIETICVGTKEVAAGSPVTAATFTYPNVQANNGWAMHIVIPEAVEADPSGDGLVPDNAVKGDGSPVRVWYTNPAGQPRTPNRLQQIPLGFRDVDQMLATEGFTMGHRGNSTRYPEMSLHAYTQTAVRGYGVMEVSVARTSDGVFFGLHDETLIRTSPTAPNAPVSGMTWAQVQAYSNTLGAQGSPAPYMRLDDYVAAYGSTHVTMFDPKHLSVASREAMFSYLSGSVGTDRAVIKYFGGGPEFAVAARAHGFLTWGFFYATGVDDGSFAEDQGVWDILGMEYSVAQSYWDTVLAAAGSRKVIAHIAPTQSAYDMGVSKGASGVQVSASHLVAPVSWWNT